MLVLLQGDGKPHQQLLQVCQLVRFWRQSLHFGVDAEVVQEAARGTIGTVHRAHEAPTLWQQSTDRRRLHGRKEGTSMEGAEVGHVSIEVDVVDHYSETGSLFDA